MCALINTGQLHSWNEKVASNLDFDKDYGGMECVERGIRKASMHSGQRRPGIWAPLCDRDETMIARVGGETGRRRNLVLFPVRLSRS
jgi:hypothetical protein